MSNDARHLKDWILALFAALDTGEPQSAAALRKLAGTRTAQIALDQERVRVAFEGDRLRVRRLAPRERWKIPHGATSRHTVSALLLGYSEVSQAISEDAIRLRGSVEDVMAICAIIEILVDASTRIPAMQTLARDFLQTGTVSDLPAWRTERRLRAERIAQRERQFLLREALLGAPS